MIYCSHGNGFSRAPASGGSYGCRPARSADLSAYNGSSDGISGLTSLKETGLFVSFSSSRFGGMHTGQNDPNDVVKWEAELKCARSCQSVSRRRLPLAYRSQRQMGCAGMNRVASAVDVKLAQNFCIGYSVSAIARLSPLTGKLANPCRYGDHHLPSCTRRPGSPSRSRG